MIQPISGATQPQPVTTPNKTTREQQTSAAHGADAVQLSAAAKTQLALLQEVSETAAQTAQEAAHGDLQAQRLLAQQAAKTSK